MSGHGGLDNNAAMFMHAVTSSPLTLDEWSETASLMAQNQQHLEHCVALERMHLGDLQKFQHILAEIRLLEAENAEMLAFLASERSLLEAEGVEKGAVEERSSKTASAPPAQALTHCEMPAPLQGFDESVPEGLTTLTVHNLPPKCRQEELFRIWPPELNGIDYLHLPYSIKQRRTTGYAFVNFRSWHAAQAFFEKWQSSHVELGAQQKTRQLHLSVTHIQGIEANLRVLKVRSDEGAINERHLPTILDENCRCLDTRALIASLPQEPQQLRK